MREFEELGVAAGKFNDGLLTEVQFKHFAAKWLEEVDYDELGILTGSLVGTLMDMERDR